jgi:hypothetical protein
MGLSKAASLTALLSMMAALLALTANPLTGQQAAPGHGAASQEDSLQAVRLACRVVRALRPPAPPARCEVEAFSETAAEYVIRLVEVPIAGAKPLEFPRSEVHIEKNERTVTVIRVPEV